MSKTDRDKRRPEQSPDRQRRQTVQLIAAVTALGSGLGVHLPTALAVGVSRNPPRPGMPQEQRPDQGDGKKPAPATPAKPGVTQAKPVPARPGVTQDKYLPARPGATQAKPVPAMPGATQAKPVPAAPGASQFKFQPETEEAPTGQELNTPLPR